MISRGDDSASGGGAKVLAVVLRFCAAVDQPLLSVHVGVGGELDVDGYGQAWSAELCGHCVP